MVISDTIVLSDLKAILGIIMSYLGSNHTFLHRLRLILRQGLDAGNLFWRWSQKTEGGKVERERQERKKNNKVCIKELITV